MANQLEIKKTFSLPAVTGVPGTLDPQEFFRVEKEKYNNQATVLYSHIPD
nr:hypothetical protein [uncultured Methanoregula sp.]